MSKWPKLPKEFKKKWIKALRSGNYIQGQELLRQRYEKNELRYCCLGVACEIGGQKPTNIRGALPGKNNQFVPKSIRNVCTVENLAKNLAGKNDSGYSFKRIAKWIEKNL